MVLPLLPTTVIGSYPQPGWLVDAGRLRAHRVPRVRASDIWRVPEPWLAQAQDDATVIAIRDMERAGIDIITDGEMRRESYSNRFALGLEGLDVDHPQSITAAPGVKVDAPRVVGPIRRRGPVEVADMAFLRANTDRTVKITLPGPFTLGQQAADAWYGDDEAMAMDFASAVNAEALDLQAAGAQVIQLDEPWLRRDPAAASRYAVRAIDRAFEGVTATRAVHLCFGYGFLVAGAKPRAYGFLEQLADSTVDQISVEAAQPGLELGALDALSSKAIMVGVLDLSTERVETIEEVADRIRAALRHVAPERLIPAPDCGMKYLTREVAFAKLRSLAGAAAKVRRELGAG